MKTVNIYVLTSDASRRVYTYQIQQNGTRVDILRRCVMQHSIRNHNWWDETYIKRAKELNIEECPHSYLYKHHTGDFYQVLKEEYDK